MTDSQEPGDLDQRRFHRAIFIYLVAGLMVVTVWQIWRSADDANLRQIALRNDHQVTEDFERIRAAVAEFQAVEGRFPQSWGELVAAGVVTGPLIDPWLERPYRFSLGANGFRAFTYGRDGVEGGDEYDADRFSND